MTSYSIRGVIAAVAFGFGIVPPAHAGSKGFDVDAAVVEIGGGYQTPRSGMFELRAGIASGSCGDENPFCFLGRFTGALRTAWRPGDTDVAMSLFAGGVFGMGK